MESKKRAISNSSANDRPPSKKGKTEKTLVDNRKVKRAKSEKSATRKRDMKSPRGAKAKNKPVKNSQTKDKTPKSGQLKEQEIKRDKHGKLVFPDNPHFKPNLTPKEVLQAGSFGGTYYRPIKSSVTGRKYN